jgi:hypothetical protein
MSKMNLTFTASVIALSLAGCATTPVGNVAATKPVAAAATTTPAIASAASPTANPAASAAAAARPAAPPAAAPAPAPGSPPPPRPFADVIKDATVTKGWFTTYQKDDKVWLEVMPDQIEKPIGLSMNVTHGIGERGLYGNYMGGFGAAQDFYVVTFRKFSPTLVQLVALNAEYGPRNASPVGLAVERSFSDSLLGTAPIVSAPHPERKSFLVEINPLLISDMSHVSFQVEQAFRQSYALDARNSSFAKVRSTDDQLTLGVKLHFGLGRLSVPVPGAPQTVPFTPPPTTLPDLRSFFMGVQYNFAKLPEQVMTPRLADARVGFFNSTTYDFSDNEKRSPKQKFVNRWRLEKKDPNAALSEPKQPIVYWLDKNIPEKYRPAITAGILEWNKAFEKIGFKDAVVVKQQKPDDDFDTSDLRHASVRWFIGKDVPFGARGPSAADPRSGEILDADIELSEEMTRIYTTRFTEDTPRPIGMVKRGGVLCSYAEMKFSEIAFAMELLDARGEITYGSVQAENFVIDGLRDLMAHEVGHTLGLRHNFRASTIYNETQVSDAEFTKAQGVSGSVMDYNPLNISLPGQKQGTYFMNTLGPYDYWAIEYGYKPFSKETEGAEIAKIASRSNEPLLAYATDEDAGYGSIVEGIDPEVNRGDLTGDPLAHYGKRVKLVRELWDKLQAKETPAGQPYEYLRRNFDRGFTQLASVSELTAKYVGGISVLRDQAGSGRAPLTPTSAEKQRTALNLLADSLFSESNFRFSPEFLSRLSVDFLDREPSWGVGSSSPYVVNLSLPDRVLSLQRSVLQKLTADGVAKRLTDSPALTGEKAPALSINELYSTLQSRIWSETDNGSATTPMRRALQREYLRWMVFTLKRESGNTPGDARVIVRAQAKQLLAKLETARRNASGGIEHRAHMDDAYDQLNSALNAVSQKLGA